MGQGSERFFGELAKAAEKKVVTDKNSAQEKGGQSHSILTTKIVHVRKASQAGLLREKRERYWNTKGWSEDMAEEEEKEWRGGPAFLSSTALANWAWQQKPAVSYELWGIWL